MVNGDQPHVLHHLEAVAQIGQRLDVRAADQRLVRPARRRAATCGRTRATYRCASMPYSRRPARLAAASCGAEHQQRPEDGEHHHGHQPDEFHLEFGQRRARVEDPVGHQSRRAAPPAPAAPARTRSSPARGSPGRRSGPDASARASSSMRDTCHRKRAQMNSRKYQRSSRNWNSGRLTQPSHQPASDGCKFPSDRHAVPARHVERHLRPPDESHPDDVDERDQQHLRRDRVAQAHRRGDGRVEPRPRRVRDQAARPGTAAPPGRIRWWTTSSATINSGSASSRRTCISMS